MRPASVRARRLEPGGRMARRLPLRDVLVLVLFAAVFLGGLSVLTSGLKAPGEVSRQAGSETVGLP